MQQRISILLILLFFSPTAYSDGLGIRGECWTQFQKLGSLAKKISAPVRGVWNFTFPKKYQVDVSQVKKEASDWEKTLSKSDDMKKEIVSQFAGNPTLEKYLGLVDAIQAIRESPPSLAGAVSAPKTFDSRLSHTDFEKRLIKEGHGDARKMRSMVEGAYYALKQFDGVVPPAVAEGYAQIFERFGRGDLATKSRTFASAETSRLAAPLNTKLDLINELDATIGNGPSLGDAVSALRDEQRIQMIWRHARLPFARAPNWKIGKTFFFRRPSTLTLTLPNRSPETIEDVASNLMLVLKAVREAETKNLRRGSPLMSLFWGNGKFSYPRLLVDRVHQSSKREYNFVKEWNEKTGAEIALPVYHQEGEALWKKVLNFLPRLVSRDPLTQVPFWNVPLVAPGVFLFPTYDPLAKYHLSDEGFKLWQKSPEALRAELAGALINKGRLNYLATSSRRLMVSALLLAGSLKLYEGTKYMMSRERVLDQQLGSEMAETMSDPQKMDRILEDYSKQENPRIVALCAKQNAPIRELIAKLQKQIAQQGDPKRNLQNTINELEAEIVRNEKIRDRLKQ